MAKSEIAQLIDVMIDMGLEMKGLRKDMDKRFESMEKRFESMDKRFESMDKRFESMDRHLVSIDKQQQRTNMSIIELRTIIINLNDDKKRVDELDVRVLRLEEKIL
jgi:chaperonin cofactor prefoldin